MGMGAGKALVASVCFLSVPGLLPRGAVLDINFVYV